MTATTTTTISPSPPETEKQPAPSLNKLLAALALGARSVNSLPLSSTPPKDNESDDDSEKEDAEDDFAYHMAFPEFNNLCNETRSKLVSLLRYTLRTSCRELVDAIGGGGEGRDEEEKDDEEEEEEEFDFEDPLLWESATEACDLLLERVDVYLQNVKEGREGLDYGQQMAVERAGALAQKKAMRAMDFMLGRLVEMEKPQITYKFLDSIQNSRTIPFQPLHHPNSPLPALLPGHGIDTRHYDGIDFRRPLPPDTVAPSHHYSHPYTDQINNLKPHKWQLQVLDEDGNRVETIGKHGRGGTLHNPDLAETTCVWINTEEGLKQLVSRIYGEDDPVSGSSHTNPQFREIAVDLEAHNYRSYNGFVCLMQLSLRRPTFRSSSSSIEGESPLQPPPSSFETTIQTAYDFLIDTLVIPRDVLNLHLAPIFASPHILKVMHGADSDIPWLQRDFGIYVVNLFDTGRAARLLPLYGSYGLAFLLRKHAGVEADKKHQLSDWRQRPLTEEMRCYAVSDVRYLLDVYDRVRLDLLGYGGGKDGGGVDGAVSIEAVLETSRKVCLIRHTAEPFRPDGYKKLIKLKRRKKTLPMSEEEELLLKKLYDWRDRIARDEDESVQYVCPDSGLKRIAAMKPRNVMSLQGVINPLPPLVLTYANQILHLVTGIEYFASASERQSKVSVSPSPPSTPGAKPQENRAMSPVLSTEELYKQAGWINPQHDGVDSSDECVTSSSDDDANYPKTADVHPANKNFLASNYTSHSLEMGNGTKAGRRGKSVSGLGAAKAMMDSKLNESGIEVNTIEMENEDAKNRSNRIRESMLRENLLDIVKSVRNFEKIETTEATKDDDDDGKEMVVDEPIPRSMQDIYRISHRNRRRAKKVAAIPPGDDATESEDVHTLEEAEALLANSGPGGGGYFEDTETNKRQRTQGESGDSSKTDTDTDLMVDLGWVKNSAEAEILHKQGSPDEIQPIELKTNAKAQKGHSSEYTGVLTKHQTNQTKHDNNRSGRVRVSEPVLPSAYSHVKGAMGIYDRDAPAPINPFFTGAAVSGGTLNQNLGKTGGQKKTVSTNNKKGKKRDMNKSNTYRS